jgi:hypothetical protein
MTARIIWLAPDDCSYLRASKIADLKAIEEKILCIKQEDELIQPGDQQRYQIMPLRTDLATHPWSDLFGGNQQALHTGGGVAEKLGQRPTIGVQANIGSVVKHFVRQMCHYA